jgi:rhamnose transport system substrate-binding protein
MKQSIVTEIAALILSLTVLGTAGYTADQPIKKGLKIAFVPKNINNPYNVIETGGSLAACKEMGVDGKVVGPSDPSASSQVSYINTLITQRQSAIVLAANDPNALIPYLKRAMEQKIKVVTMDSDTAPEGRSI